MAPADKLDRVAVVLQGGADASPRSCRTTYRLITEVMRIVIQVLFAWQRKTARRAGHRDARNLAVAFIQRYGGAINANVHGHIVMPDAVWLVPQDDDAML